MEEEKGKGEVRRGEEGREKQRGEGREDKKWRVEDKEEILGGWEKRKESS